MERGGALCAVPQFLYQALSPESGLSVYLWTLHSWVSPRPGLVGGLSCGPERLNLQKQLVRWVGGVRTSVISDPTFMGDNPGPGDPTQPGPVGGWLRIDL